jgi:hypothetical protein
MRGSTNEYFHRANVTNYNRLLTEGPDTVQRQMLLKLIAKEVESFKRERLARTYLGLQQRLVPLRNVFHRPKRSRRAEG